MFQWKLEIEIMRRTSLREAAWRYEKFIKRRRVIFFRGFKTMLKKAMAKVTYNRFILNLNKNIPKNRYFIYFFSIFV